MLKAMICQPNIIKERIEPYRKDLTDKEAKRLEHDIMYDILFEK